MKLSDKQKKIIEKFALVEKESGMHSTAGRILGLFFVTDNRGLSFAQIQETLSMSKPSLSRAINLLLDLNKITYYKKFGDRKRYFNMNLENIQLKIGKMMKSFFKAKEVLAEVLELDSVNSSELCKFVNWHIDFIDFIGEEFGNAITKWIKMNKEKNEKDIFFNNF